MKHQLVYLEWLDSSRTPYVGWENRKGLQSLPAARCESVGVVLEETDEYITLAQNMTEHQVLGRISIPKIAITNKCTLLWKLGKQ